MSLHAWPHVCVVLALIWARNSFSTPREIIHIVGGSGVGKKTLIRRLLSPMEERLRAKLRIERGCRAFGYSFQNSASDILFAEGSQLVHQWQFNTHHLIEKAHSEFPKAHHRILVLWRPVQIHCIDLMKRTPEWTWVSEAALEQEWECDLNFCARDGSES